MNRWSYVEGNPMNGVDLLGLRAIDHGTLPWYLQPVPIFDPCSKLNKIPSENTDNFSRIKLPKINNSGRFNPGSFGYGGGVMAGFIGGNVGVDVQPNSLNEICKTTKFCVHLGLGGYIGSGTNIGISNAEPSPTKGSFDLSMEIGADAALLLNGGGSISVGFNPSDNPGITSVGASTALPWLNFGGGARVYVGLCGARTTCYKIY